MDTLYTVRFREVSGLSSFKNFYNQTTGCGDIAYCLVGYFILSHPVYVPESFHHLYSCYCYCCSCFKKMNVVAILKVEPLERRSTPELIHDPLAGQRTGTRSAVVASCVMRFTNRHHHHHHHHPCYCMILISFSTSVSLSSLSMRSKLGTIAHTVK